MRQQQKVDRREGQSLRLSKQLGRAKLEPKYEEEMCFSRIEEGY